MSRTPPSPSSLRVADLNQSGKTGFALRPEKDRLTALAAELGLSALRKLSFEGHVAPEGPADWRLEGHLGATVVQPCVVTLDPVTTRIETPVTRVFAKDYVEPDEPEAEMPEDDTIERLGPWIDPEAVMLEALALNIPEYPRLPDAELGALRVTEPGKAPLTDDDVKPFAGLAGLKEQLERKDD